MKNLLSASTLLLCLSGLTAAKKNDLFQPLQQLASKGSSNATLDARSLVKRACAFGEVICDVNYCVDTSDVCCGDGNGAYCYEGQKCCSNSDYCAPDDGVCCGSLGSCPNGYECATVDGEPGCCPESGCSSFGLDDDDDLVDLDDDIDDTDVTVYTQVIYWYVYVYWYIEIWYYIEVDVETSTLSLTSSEERTSSTATVTASNSRAASSEFASISESVTEAATTTPDLDSIPTSTTTTDSTSAGSSTPTATGTSGADDDNSDNSDNTINIEDLLSPGEPTPSPTDDAASTLGSSEALWYTGIFNAFLGLFVLL
ncbi:hypothetical protein BJX68DRAFT_229916 [Aspergillus pseudodeflectus]|uniref:GPI anchored protein n=1 Tax=Aspergillus pseudodeflectus TaxID=176178 RepID=A0ABR4KXI6_9EURO